MPQNSTVEWASHSVLPPLCHQLPISSSSSPRVDSKEWDIVITGMGNWAMCGNLVRLGVGLWPLKKYYTEITRIGKQLKAFIGRTGARVIWHTQPAFPWLPDTYRNNARIGLFNAYSTSVMHELGIEVVFATCPPHTPLCMLLCI